MKRFILAFVLFFATDALAQNAIKGDAKRGFQIFRTVCSSCHGMNELHYGDFAALNIPLKKLEDWTATHRIPDGINDNGTIKFRAASLNDAVASPYLTPGQAKKENWGDVPPDLSDITRTVKGGAPYILAMLRDFKNPDASEFPPGDFDNPIALTHHKHFHMPDPWRKFNVENSAQASADITAFLEWSAQPYEATRTKFGLFVLLYAIGMSVVFCLLRFSVWRALPDSAQNQK